MADAFGAERDIESVLLVIEDLGREIGVVVAG